VNSLVRAEVLGCSGTSGGGIQLVKKEGGAGRGRGRRKETEKDDENGSNWRSFVNVPGVKGGTVAGRCRQGKDVQLSLPDVWGRRRKQALGNQA